MRPGRAVAPVFASDAWRGRPRTGGACVEAAWQMWLDCKDRRASKANDALAPHSRKPDCSCATRPRPFRSRLEPRPGSAKATPPPRFAPMPVSARATAGPTVSIRFSLELMRHPELMRLYGNGGSRAVRSRFPRNESVAVTFSVSTRSYPARFVLTDRLRADPWSDAIGQSPHRQARLLSRQSQPLSEHGAPPGLCTVSPWNRSGRAKERIVLGSIHDQDAA